MLDWKYKCYQHYGPESSKTLYVPQMSMIDWLGNLSTYGLLRVTVPVLPDQTAGLAINFLVQKYNYWLVHRKAQKPWNTQ